ncbi:MAG: caspase family protein [Desulfobacterales bacterium]|nr:caspase family protein [Desulfobacterales bacterium]
MGNKYAIIVAIEEYHDKNNLGKVHFALNDANGIKSAIEKLGYEKDNIEFLTNNHATRTTTFEVIKKISNYAQKGESILFYYAGHGFYSDGKNLISCVDTSLSSLHETCISLQDILGIFNQSKSTQIMLFLDCCHSGLEFDIALRSPISLFSTDALKYEYSNSEFLTGFAACKGEEKSIPDSENKHGAWSYFLIKALSGEAENIYKNGLLFSDNLQKYLNEETFNRIKLITTDKKNQTPIQFGKNTDKFIVADISEILSQKIIKKASSSIKFEKVTLLTEEEGYVASLPGFIKGRHKAPKEISEYHENWIRSIAQDLIKEEINEVGEYLRKTLRLKLKQILRTTVEEGIGEIITTEFDYIVVINQSEDDAEAYLLKRSIENFKNSEIIYSEKFNEVFDEYFDEIELKTKQEIDIESLIEKIEDIDDDDVLSVSYDLSDISECTITIPSISQTLLVSGSAVLVKSRKKQSPLQLISDFKECYKQLASNSIQYLLE